MKSRGGGGGLQAIMRQANQMQNRMKKLQDELATREFEASSGGGAVSITVNGDHKLTKVVVSPDVVEAGDHEMLQDLILTAANEALTLAKTTSQTEMEKVTGGLSMPGMF